MNTRQRIIETLREVDSDICNDLNILIGQLINEAKQEVFDDLEATIVFNINQRNVFKGRREKHLHPIIVKPTDEV